MKDSTFVDDERKNAIQMSSTERQLLSGDSAIALAALHGGVALGTGYPGTPSTEILEYLSHIGGKAQWSPNEKVALEVGIGVAYGGARSLVTMKHVGLNVAADPFFSVAHTGVVGALVVVSADDPGMASSQNEQDNRRYAVAAAVPMLEPSDSQEAYDFTLAAIEISERWKIPVLLRVTTRVCHTQAPVQPRAAVPPPQEQLNWRMLVYAGSTIVAKIWSNEAFSPPAKITRLLTPGAMANDTSKSRLHSTPLSPTSF